MRRSPLTASRAVALGVALAIGVTLFGCARGSDGPSPRPAPTSATPAPATTARSEDDALSDDEIADIEKQLDAIDQLLDDLEAELRHD